MSATAAPTIADAREAIADEIREVKVRAIKEAIRELGVAISYLKWELRELGEIASPPFVRVFPPRESSI